MPIIRKLTEKERRMVLECIALTDELAESRDPKRKHKDELGQHFDAANRHLRNALHKVAIYHPEQDLK